MAGWQQGAQCDRPRESDELPADNTRFTRQSNEGRQSSQSRSMACTARCQAMLADIAGDDSGYERCSLFLFHVGLRSHQNPSLPSSVCSFCMSSSPSPAADQLKEGERLYASMA